MDQQIRFCTTSDGVSIAYAVVGSGPPLVYVSGWPSHLALEWEEPFVREFLETFGRSFTLVRYDMRRTGLSAGGSAEMTLDALARDLDAVVNDAGLETFALMSLGLLAGPVAITYGAAHPERVSRLVLLSPFLRGDQIMTEEQYKALAGYVTAFGRFIAPDPGNRREEQLDQARVRGATQIHDASAPPEVFAELMGTFYHVDVTADAERLQTPALVLYGNRDAQVPLAVARDVATRLPNVTFVPYQGAGSAAWADREVIVPEIWRFLGEAPPEIGPAAPAAAAPGSMVTVLFTDMDSSTAVTQRLGDAKAQELVRAHNTIVREALAGHGGREIKHTGDGIMASFPTASGALECAVAIQRGVAAREGELSVHVGLNAGEPLAEEADLFGTAVQLARRICDHAGGGEILVADVVRQLAAGKGFLFADRGEVVPKGFEEPVRLYEVRWREEP